jgi:hypothetical protein
MTSSASNRQQTLAALHQRLSELPNGAVLAEDETHVNLLPWVPATWIATGSRQQVITPARTGGAPSSARLLLLWLLGRFATTGTS